MTLESSLSILLILFEEESDYTEKAASEVNEGIMSSDVAEEASAAATLED